MKKFNLMITREARLNSLIDLPRLIKILKNIDHLNIITDTKNLPPNAKSLLVEYTDGLASLRGELGLSVDEVIIEPHIYHQTS